MSVLTIGSFDPVHADHVRLFKLCEKLDDHVVVGVNSDAFYRQYRGLEPMFTERERMEQVLSCGYTPVLNDGPGRELVEQVLPEYLVIGSDWLKKDYLAQIDMQPEDFERLGVTLVYVPRGTTVYATDVRRRLRES